MGEQLSLENLQSLAKLLNPNFLGQIVLLKSEDNQNYPQKNLYFVDPDSTNSQAHRLGVMIPAAENSNLENNQLNLAKPFKVFYQNAFGPNVGNPSISPEYRLALYELYKRESLSELWTKIDQSSPEVLPIGALFVGVDENGQYDPEVTDQLAKRGYDSYIISMGNNTLPGNDIVAFVNLIAIKKISPEAKLEIMTLVPPEGTTIPQDYKPDQEEIKRLLVANSPMIKITQLGEKPLLLVNLYMSSFTNLETRLANLKNLVKIITQNESQVVLLGHFENTGCDNVQIYDPKIYTEKEIQELAELENALIKQIFTEAGIEFWLNPEGHKGFFGLKLMGVASNIPIKTRSEPNSVLPRASSQVTVMP